MNSLPAKVAVLVVVFVVVTAIASVAGAKNLGTAATFGQVAFGLTLVGLMLRGPRLSTASSGADAADGPRPD